MRLRIEHRFDVFFIISFSKMSYECRNEMLNKLMTVFPLFVDTECCSFLRIEMGERVMWRSRSRDCYIYREGGHLIRQVYIVARLPRDSHAIETHLSSIVGLGREPPNRGKFVTPDDCYVSINIISVFLRENKSKS